MKKIKNKGFMLMETLVVSTFVVTTLTILFVQFQRINRNFDITFTYNTVNGLYATNNIHNFIKPDVPKIVEELDKSSVPYLDITSCPTYITSQEYCKALMTSLKVKKVLFTKEDITDLKENIKENTEIDQKLKDFIKYISDAKNDNYRLIVEFTDATYATLKLENEV